MSYVLEVQIMKMETAHVVSVSLRACVRKYAHHLIDGFIFWIKISYFTKNKRRQHDYSTIEDSLCNSIGICCCMGY